MVDHKKWLKLEQIDAWIRTIGRGQLIDFGYCPSEEIFTPVVFLVGVGGYLESLGCIPAKCPFCGLSNIVDPDQTYPGYSARGNMSDKRREELISLGLHTAEGQKKWLREKIKSQYDEAEIEMRQAMDKVRWLADEKRHLAEAMRLLNENN